MESISRAQAVSPSQSLRPRDAPGRLVAGQRAASDPGAGR